MIVHISIGNSDDKLTQREWANYQDAFLMMALSPVSYPDCRVHGVLYSTPDSPYQTMCLCLELSDSYMKHNVRQLKSNLSNIAFRFRQDSIAWNETPETVFLPAKEMNE